MSRNKIDLTDTELFVTGDPHPVWKWLRQNQPVYWNGDDSENGFWVLTRYEDITNIYRDPSTFSSKDGTVMGGSYRSKADTASGKMIICSDPPRHALLRRPVAAGFRDDALQRVNTLVHELVDRALDRMLRDGGCDFATDVAPYLAVGGLMGLMAVSEPEAHHLLELSRRIIGYRDSETRGDGPENVALVCAQTEMFAAVSDIIERRRRQRGGDMISMLLDAEVNGRSMSTDVVVYNVLNVAVGGNETTPYTACGGVQALIKNPEQHQRLLSEPELVPTAVEEILRWTSTNAYVQRTVTRDVTIRGQTILAGQRVTLWNAAANRDEAVFPDADRFDVARDPNPHIAFGGGNHFCVGAKFARLELTVLFERLMSRRVQLELAGPVDRLRSNFLLGVKHMPVKVL
jgi:cytochrome P450